MRPPLNTVLVGAGRVGLGTPGIRGAAGYEYSTHAEVLADHPAFRWNAVVDRSPEALAAARAFGIPICGPTVADLPADYAPDVAVLATPPAARAELLRALPRLRGLLVEKPLGTSSAERQAFAAECRRRDMPVQVNLWRRADSGSRALAAGELEALIGPAQAVFAVYGNGLVNNGTHLVDFVRMLFGEVAGVQAAAGASAVPGGPLAGDPSLGFTLILASGLAASVAPLDFGLYREVALDVWGASGRLQVLQEGLSVLVHEHAQHRALPHEHEVASDNARQLGTTAGRALYEMYDNLADAILGGAELWSPLESALRTEATIDAVRRSAAAGGTPVAMLPSPITALAS